MILGKRALSASLCVFLTGLTSSATSTAPATPRARERCFVTSAHLGRVLRDLEFSASYLMCGHYIAQLSFEPNYIDATIYGTHEDTILTISGECMLLFRFSLLELRVSETI